MNILFTSEAVVEVCNGKYYKTNSKQFIDRYHSFGHVIFCAFSKEVESSKQPELKCDDVEYIFLKKETSICSLLKTRRENQQILRNIISNVDIVVAHLPSNIGMEAIAIAKEYGVPFYSVAPTSTIDFSMKEGKDIPIEERNPDEVRKMGEIQLAPADIPVFNPSFDITPHQNITGIITEEGIIYPPFDKNIERIKKEKGL